MIEDGVPRILRLVRPGHRRRDTDDLYSDVTDVMVESMLTALQRRWEQDGGCNWDETPGQEQDAA
ncbi:hypothetical protein [Amycolatopsis viridis]|uniref:Uncharacterized protein n=1 Tax=Amycolatopsis viridis TaxID=185678 RepID=A0ABX0T281_9PSEU|nr:hypothetical protein [Amycolatopsis viridis]NIH81665.1 hypothetical protein [Amycolatopsis viridis]